MLTVFILSFVAEVAYATYTVFVSHGYKFRSVAASAAMALLRMTLTYKVVFSIETLPALIVGQVLGTLVVMSVCGRPNTASRPTALAAVQDEEQALTAQRLKHDG